MAQKRSKACLEINNGTRFDTSVCALEADRGRDRSF